MASSSKCLFNQETCHQNYLSTLVGLTESSGECGGNETECRDLCENRSDFPLSKGVNSKMEYLLLQHGCYDLDPINLYHYRVCENHLKLINSHIIKSCSICKPIFSRRNSNRGDLRVIDKLHAFAIWKKDKKSFFGKVMCASCRKTLDNEKNNYITNEIKQQCDQLFEWLYNFDVVHTPTTISSKSDTTSYSPTIYSGAARDDQEALKNFLRSMNYKYEIPVTFSYNARSSKSKENFCRFTKHILQFIVQIVAPNDSNQVWSDIVEAAADSSNVSNIHMGKDFEIVMRGLAESYENCDHWSTRQQILSTFAKEVSLPVIQKFIPDLTDWRFKQARAHADSAGKGSVVDTSRQPTVRYTDEQIAHFVQFITSPHVSTDLPFKQKTLTLSTGEEIEIPNVIRNLIPTRIIDQYILYCTEMSPGFVPLGTSSLYSILSECSASTRKSLQGLDYFAADGSSSFDTLMKLTDELLHLGILPSDISAIKKNLQASKNYLKTDYKVHVQRESTVPDHCSTFALSDSNEKLWQQECKHHHNDKCERCELMNETFSAIELCISKIGDSALRELLSHRLKHHVRIIGEWKAHQLRLVHQDHARTELLQQLDEETVFLYIDWAMKWLPVRYREAQRDFFAKRGLSWHVSYVIRKAPIDQSLQSSLSPSELPSFSQLTTSQKSDVSKSEQLSSSPASPPAPQTPYQHKTFVHVFDQCVQNGKTVLSILHHVLLRLKEEFPGIKYAHIRADNAGCYHGAEVLLSTSTLYKATGTWIKSMDFCDPQGGKGPCDRMAAVIKCLIRCFINQKNNCTTAVEFCKAASDTKGLEIHACTIDVQNVEKIEWPGISSFHNIQYTSDEVRVWRSWKIGEGKTFKWSKIPALKSINVLKSVFTPNQKCLWILESKTNVNKDNNLLKDEERDFSSSDEDEENSDSTQMFYCPENECTKQFRKYENLLNHIASGKHHPRLERMTLLDRSKLLYKETLEAVHDQPLPSLPFQFHVVKNAPQKSSTSQLKQNWAALTRKPAIQFSDKQKKYLTDKFEQGVQGMKWDPQAVALEMEVGLSSTGTPLFDHHEWLTDTQIKGFFGRLAAARRKQKSPQSAAKSQRSSTSQLSQSDSDDESEELDTTALDVDEIISRVADPNASKVALQPTTFSTNIQQHKKKDISMDDIQSAAKRQHK